MTNFVAIGNDLNPPVVANSANECASQCKEREGCTHFTLVKYVCFLKKSGAGRRQAEEMVSGACHTKRLLPIKNNTKSRAIEIFPSCSVSSMEAILAKRLAHHQQEYQVAMEWFETSQMRASKSSKDVYRSLRQAGCNQVPRAHFLLAMGISNGLLTNPTRDPEELSLVYIRQAASYRDELAILALAFR